MANQNLHIAESHGLDALVDTVLNNEFNKYTGQDLSDYELLVLKDYIDFFWSVDWMLSDIHSIVLDFISDCYIENDHGFTMRDWWEFPMAVTRVDGNKTITTYRGGTTVKYN